MGQMVKGYHGMKLTDDDLFWDKSIFKSFLP